MVDATRRHPRDHVDVIDSDHTANQRVSHWLTILLATPTDRPMTEIARRESEFLLYSAPDGAVKVGVLFRDETAWPTQRALAALFGVKVPAIAKHLKNIFESWELDQAATVSKMEMVQSEGGRDVLREVTLYNLDAIIAVGYRVNSYQATQFRIWATRRWSWTIRPLLQPARVLPGRACSDSPQPRARRPASGDEANEASRVPPARRAQCGLHRRDLGRAEDRRSGADRSAEVNTAAMTAQSRRSRSCPARVATSEEIRERRRGAGRCSRAVTPVD